MTLPLADDERALLDDIAYCDRGIADSWNALLDGRCTDAGRAVEKRRRLMVERERLVALLAELRAREET